MVKEKLETLGMDSAGLISRAFFLWIQPVLRAGFRRPLEDGEAPPFPKRLREGLQERFQHLWADELAHGKLRRKGPSLRRVCFTLVKGDFMMAFMLQLTAVCCKFSCLLVIHRLARIVSTPGDVGSSEGLFQQYEGFFCVGFLWVLTVSNGLLETNATFSLQLALYAVQICVSHSVLEKGMILHPDAQANYRRGDLVSLALSDFNRVVEISAWLMMGFTSPFVLLIAFAIMATLLGPFVFVGLVVALLGVWFIGRLGEIQGGMFRAKMVATGSRMSLLNEMLQSMRFTKYYGMEEHYQTQILQTRKKEEKALKGMKYILASVWPTGAVIPPLILALVLCLNLFIHGHLPDQAATFAVLGAAKFLYIPISLFGNFLSAMNMMKVTIDRLQDLLMQPEIKPVPFQPVAQGIDVLRKQPAVRIANQSFSWSASQKAPLVLQDINLDVPQGELWAVVGELGSGKSSLLHAIMGRMIVVNFNSSSSRAAQEAPDFAAVLPGVPIEDDNGSAFHRSDRLHRSVVSGGTSRVYVAQEPMIMNATVKDNVIFGLSAQNGENLEELYDKSLVAAALKTDLDLLPAGDKTEIGEKGITLSGGQKARVALARAVLAAKVGGLVLLDDPLSAVDPQVGEHIFQKCIVRELAGTTRLLVTNQLHFLNHSAVANIIVMKKGCIVEQGTFGMLRANPESAFSKMLESVGGSHEKETDTKDDGPDTEKEQVKMSNPRKTTNDLEDDEKGKLTEKEQKEEGAVTWKSISFYIKNLGGMHVMIGLFLAGWTNDLIERTPDTLLVIWKDDLLGQEEDQYLTLWLSVVGAGMLLKYLTQYVWVWASLPACRKIHFKMLTKLLHCPMSFFDRTPSGRLMNRMGEDQMFVDWTVPMYMETVFMIWGQVVDQLAMAIYVRPLITPCVFMMVICLYIVAEMHRRTYREVIRWWMVTKSPVFNTFEEILSGTTTIFAFGHEKYFVRRFEKALFSNLEWLMTRDSTNLWMDLRLVQLGAILSGVLAVLILLLPGQASSSFGLVALIYSVELGNTLKYFVYFIVQTEGTFASVERCADFCQVDQEPAWRLPSDADSKVQKLPGVKCTLEFVSVCLRYQPHLPRALDCVSAAFAPCEKIGIVGRTGSGKSTIMGTLFRLCALDDGKVLIEGIDISKIGLKPLRRLITIVPQDPVLFSGPVRKNLDPTAARSDKDIWACLQRCYLTELIEGLEGGLDAQVAPGGANFSVGERQVLCLARALLRSSPILCLDEATANVDPVNDQKIQQILQTQMQELLVLTIAHRLHTVMHSDRIMVLDKGKLAQLDSPQNLLKTPGIFQDLATIAGISATDVHPTNSVIGTLPPGQPTAVERQFKPVLPVTCRDGADSANDAMMNGPMTLFTRVNELLLDCGLAAPSSDEHVVNRGRRLASDLGIQFESVLSVVQEAELLVYGSVKTGITARAGGSTALSHTKH